MSRTPPRARRALGLGGAARLAATASPLSPTGCGARRPARSRPASAPDCRKRHGRRRREPPAPRRGADDRRRRRRRVDLCARSRRAGWRERGIATRLVVLGPSPRGRPERRGARRSGPGADRHRAGARLAGGHAPEVGRGAGAGVARSGAIRSAPDLVHLNSPGAGRRRRAFGAPVLGACHSCLATWWLAVRQRPRSRRTSRWRTRLHARGPARLRRSRRAQPRLRARRRRRPTAFPRRRGGPQRARRTRRRRRRLRARAAGLHRRAAVGRGQERRRAGRAAARLRGAGAAPPGRCRGRTAGRVDLATAVALGRLPAAAVAAWLRRARGLRLAALYEPFGLAVLEAAQAGCALVLSDIPTFRELWDGAAVFADPHDPRPAAAAFDAPARPMPASARALGDAARERARRATRSRR